jgi:hypothetical protein
MVHHEISDSQSDDTDLIPRADPPTGQRCSMCGAAYPSRTRGCPTHDPLRIGRRRMASESTVPFTHSDGSVSFRLLTRHRFPCRIRIPAGRRSAEAPTIADVSILGFRRPPQ